MIFARFRELGSARQAHLSMSAEQVRFPRPSDDKKLTSFDWTSIRYRNVISSSRTLSMLELRQTEKWTDLIEGRLRKSYGRGKSLEEWEVTSATGRCRRI